MSWEAWGTPPDTEPELCPICDNTQHTPDKCEVAAAEDRARKHYEGAIALILQDRERRLTEAYAEGRKDEAEVACVNAASPLPEWLSIETAPEDTNVLVATQGGYVDTAFWTDDGDGRKWWWLESANKYAPHPIHDDLVPTHWMPLPKHPEAA